MNSLFYRLRMGRSIIGLFILVVAAWPIKAQFNYTTADGAITITGYNGPGGNVGIPSAINGVPVVAIGGQSFYGQTSLSSLTISNGIGSIGSYAFFGCANLTNVVFPNSLTNMGDQVFASCTGLTSVSLPGSVTNLGEVPFYLCSGLKAISVAPTNPAFSSVAGVLFNKTLSKLLEGPGSISGNYVVPATVKEIGDNAFWECTGLTGITIPTNVVVIEGGAVGYCGGLTNLDIPASATNIGVWAFYGCSNLTAINVNTNNPAFSSVNGILFDRNRSTLIQFPAGAATNSYTIPNSVTRLAQSAFSYCANLTNVTIPGTVNDIEDGAFEYCSSLAAIAVPDTVTNLGDQAFYYCPDLARATIGSGITSLGLEEFGFCTSLSNVTLGNNVTNIGSEAFYECESLTSLSLPAGVLSIEFQAFSLCYNLQSLALPDRLINIGDYAFQLCGLTNLAIPAGVTNIGSSVFQSCSSLAAINVDSNNPAYRSIDGVLFDRSQSTLIRYPAAKSSNAYAIPDGVTSIAEGAFTASDYLSSVTFPDSLTTIGQFAFAACDGLTAITLPASMTNLDGYAFSVCYNLSSVYCYGNAPTVTPQSFYSDNATVYYLPGTAGWGATLGSEFTALWLLSYPVILTSPPTFGVQTNRFGFTISWATNALAVVEACTNLTRPVWLPIATNTLTAGTFYFSDPTWTKVAARFYRVASQ